MEKHGTRSSVNRSVMQMVVAAMMLAMAVLLDFFVSYVPGLNWPNGGTITLAMLPLFLAGFLAGPFWGFAVSFLFGVFDLLLGEAWGFNWASILLDYILGFGVCGVCGFFARSFYRKSLVGPIVGMSLAGVLRFLCSFISGCVVMWDISDTGTFDPHFDAGTMTYSAVYNLGYILPSIVLSIIVFGLISKPIFTLSDSRILANLRPKSIALGNEGKSGFLARIGFDRLLPALGAILVVCGALSCVPTINYQAAGDDFVVDFLALGYVALVFSAILAVYSIVRLALFRKKSREEALTQQLCGNAGTLLKVYVPAIVLFVVALALAIVGLCLHFSLGSVVVQG